MTVDKFLQWMRYTFIGAKKPPRLEENAYPQVARGVPDLKHFKKPVEHYARYIEDYLSWLESPRAPRGSPEASPEWDSYHYQKFVLGGWGLIARGPADALPTVLRLLQHKAPEGRQAASGVLERWAEDGTQLGAPVLAAAEKELAGPDTDVETLATLIGILGRIKSEAALPLITRVLRDPKSKYGDLDWCAIEAIGDFAGKKFVKEPEPAHAAELWLQQRGL